MSARITIASLAPMTIREAIAHAKAKGWTICSYTSPTEEGREGISAEMAMEIAREDPSLVYFVRRAGARP